MQTGKHNLIPSVLLSAALATAAGCASHKEGRITVDPDVQVLSLDTARSADLDVTLCVPEGYVPRRSRLYVTPLLYSGDSLVETYPSVALDGSIYTKKLRRAQVLEGKVDTVDATEVDKRKSYRIDYHQTVCLPDGLDGGEVIACVSTDGCGTCEDIDTVQLAGISNPVTLMQVEESLKTDWIEPEFRIKPKVREGKGVARLQFVINRHDIRTDLGNNEAELDTMLAKLGPILADSLATLNSVQITGVASADGPLSINVPLARNRANSAFRWLVGQLDIDSDDQRHFAVTSRPEGWGPVLDAMRAAGDRDTTAVAEVLDRYADSNDDVQERYIRRLPCWGRIRDNYLQKDRNVEYVYSYQIKSFTTDAELLEIYGKRPDAFSEDELLRVSTLKTGDEAKDSVYRTILHYFPQSKVAANNLAVLLLRKGEDKEAREVFDSADGYSEESLRTAAALYVYNKEYEEAVELLDTDVDDPEARYNLGLVKAQLRQLDEAYELLAPFRDINSAIAALSVNKNEEADDIMDGLSSATPRDEYVRALIAARLSRHDEVLEHLANAAADASLRERAKGEYDFIPYRDEVEFRAAVYKQQ